MEWFDLYNRQGEKLPKTMTRGGENSAGEYHLVVHIWMRNQAGDYLIQQRNKQSDLIPHQWGTTSGAVSKGETSIGGALREIKEEIGLTLSPKDLTLVKRYFIDDTKANYITDVYLVLKDIDLSTLTLLESEVKDVSYASMEKIHSMIQNNTFWNYEQLLERKGYFALLEKS